MKPKSTLLSGLIASLLLTGTDAFSSLQQPRAPQFNVRSSVPLSTSTKTSIVAGRQHASSTYTTACSASNRCSARLPTKRRRTVLQNSKSASSGGSSRSSPSSSLGLEAAAYMALLALQFGLQPGLVRKFTPQTICRSTVVMMQEILKVVISSFVLFVGNKDTRKEALKGWNLKTALLIGGLPAALYCVQNMAALMAYQNLEPLTFNVLNQTKTLSAALCCYLIMGRKQSKTQMVSLVILLSSALIIERVISLSAPFISFGGGGAATTTAAATKHLTQGVAPILLASFISGLAGALAQRNLQPSPGNVKGGRNAYLFNMEMCSASALILAVSLLFTADGSRIRAAGFFDGWTPQTWIPIVTNALGGIIVGLVTKHAGAVRKGFALIFGILISGLWEVQTVGITKEQIIGGALAALSLWMHTAYPYKSKDERKKE